MRFKTKKEAIAGITMRKRVVNGVEYPIFCSYLGTNYITKKIERLYASDKNRLISMIEDYYRARSQQGELSSILSPEQIIDANVALNTLKEAKIDISLTECAKREVERQGRALSYTETAGHAFDDYFDSKVLNSDWEKQKTECTVGSWIGKIGRDRILSTVTVDEIAEYLKTNYGEKAPKTYNSHLSYIKTFLSWCANPAQKLIPENPAIVLKAKPVAWKRPKYLKPDDVKKIFDALWDKREEHPEWLALAVTQFFIGVRREEVLRMAVNPDTATILLEDETFRVDGGKGHTKGIAPRAAHLQPNAVAWMKSFDYMTGINKVGITTTSDYYDHVRKLGVPVFTNCARHTFITMHVAKFHTPEVTQAMVGTSGTMRAVHYDGLAPQREGEAYFDIFPPVSQPESDSSALSLDL